MWIHGRIQNLKRLFVVALLLLSVVVNGGGQEDLYKILGVKRSATVKEIKKAYRRKALDTHPDKNKDVSPEVAAAEFHKVVHAFEILSDTASRQRYDRTGRTDQNANQGGGGGGGYGGGGQHFNFNFFFQQGGGGRRQYRPRKLKDKFEVKQAQSRVMHIVSLEQLKTVMLDDDDKLERNLLMVFVTPQDVETLTDDEIVFPYPFAAKSSQGIWWEDLLQTAKIRFYKKNDIQEFFGLPNGDEIRRSGKPIFLFGKRGQSFSDPFEQLQTSDRATFEEWVWKRIEVPVQFINHHTHEVEVYWIHGTKANVKFNLKPGETAWHSTMLSHEWWIRDARVDTRPDSPGRWKLTDESCLASWKILSDEPGQKLIIEPRTCYDLSGHCTFWQRQGECRKNPNFMGEVCRLTCKLCSKEDDERLKGQSPQHDNEEQQNNDNWREQKRQQQRQEQERRRQQKEQQQQRQQREEPQKPKKKPQQPPDILEQIKVAERARKRQQDQQVSYYISCLIVFLSTLLPIFLFFSIPSRSHVPPDNKKYDIKSKSSSNQNIKNDDNKLVKRSIESKVSRSCNEINGHTTLQKEKQPVS